MQNLPQSSTAAPANVLGQQEFLSRIGQLRNEIRSVSADVQQISQLHQAALSGADDSAQRRVDDVVAATQQKNNNIRDQLRTLKADVEATPLNSSGASTKKRQWEVLNSDFQKELRAYLEEEQSFRERYRQQIGRQYRIVNPDADEEEVKRAANMDWGNEGVFQSAVGVFELTRLSVPPREPMLTTDPSFNTVAPAKPTQFSAMCARDTTSSSRLSSPSISWSP